MAYARFSYHFKKYSKDCIGISFPKVDNFRRSEKALQLYQMLSRKENPLISSGPLIAFFAARKA